MTTIEINNKLAEHTNALVELTKELEETKKTEVNYCIKCGKEITDYEETEFLQQEGKMIFTYKCSCGFYGEQVYKVQYSHTEEV